MHLSLYGSQPLDDYKTLVYEFEGRRINRHVTAKSLLLRKPLGELGHGGDQLFTADSPEYKLLKTWLDQAAVLDQPVQVTSLQVKVRALSTTASEQFQLQVLAGLDGGSATRDVTGLTQWTIVDADSVELEPSTARVKLLRSGRHILLARYLNRVEAVTLIQPFESNAGPVEQQPKNFIDQAINGTLAEMHVQPAPGISDAQFLRRVCLDVTGKLPEPELLRAFLESDALDKRERLVDRLLASVAFNDHWTLLHSQWLRLHSLPNEPQAAQAYGDWIRQCISDGQPWNEMTRQMVTATGDSHEVGPANMCRMVGDARTHAEMVSEVFLGVRLGCANCHDHPLDRWTQDDYHGLAGMLARVDRGRQVAFTNRGDVTHPKLSAPARWRLPGDRYVDQASQPQKVLSDWLTDPDQQRLAPAYANRIWAAMFGRGLVEPVDDLRVTNPASHPQLFSQIAEYCASHDFDLRCLVRTIAGSETYARASRQQTDALYAWHQSARWPPMLWPMHWLM